MTILTPQELKELIIELDVLDDLLIEARITQGSLLQACAELIVEHPYQYAERDQMDKAKEILNQFSRKAWINRVACAMIGRVIDQGG